MSSSTQGLAHVHAWCDPRTQPIIYALYRRDSDTAEKLYAQAQQELESAELSADERSAAACYLHQLRFYFHRAFEPAAEHRSAFETALERIDNACCGPVSELAQTIVKLELVVNGERSGFGDVPEEQFSALLNGIPEAERSAQMWHNVATWAFTHRHAGLLQQAFEALVLAPTEFADQYPFQRVNLMYKLIRGEADSRHISEFLQLLRVINEIHEFKRYIWPYIEELGIADQELAELVELTRVKLESRAPEPPLG